MTSDQRAEGPLAGVRIIDLTSVVMGPYATQILGDFGADIVKVESPGGDTTRGVTPMRNPRMGWAFLHMNRNKRSIVLDLKKPEGLDALLRLVETADAIVSNVRPRALARLGVTYERIAAINPGIIFLSLIGFNEDGPYAGQPLYEDLVQGLTAVPNLLVAAGSPHPHYVPLSFNDRGVGLNAAIALLSAIIGRTRTGRGQQIEVPMFETMVQAALGDQMGGLTFDPPIGPAGYTRTLTPERRPYATRDGFICVIIYTDRHWQSYLALLGKAELFETDPRLRTMGSRNDHAHELYALLSEAMLTRTTAEWLAVLHGADIPATPLHTLDSLVADPHLAAIGFINTVEHPSEGPIREMAIPSRWSDTQPSVRRRAPRLGEQSAEILRDAGFDDADIGRMIATGATVQAE
jgi:crotonobetainyl-CoA:carnitine CoA-transferase CaiB-like acyl-CoA transferase